MTDLRLKRADRVRSPADFKRAYRRRRSAADATLIVYACRNELPISRLGLSVSRRVGGAVVRNRWKRILREAFRHSKDRIPAGLDLVVLPRPGAVAELAAVRRSLERLAGRLGKGLLERHE